MFCFRSRKKSIEQPKETPLTLELIDAEHKIDRPSYIPYSGTLEEDFHYRWLHAELERRLHPKKPEPIEAKNEGFGESNYFAAAKKFNPATSGKCA